MLKKIIFINLLLVSSVICCDLEAVTRAAMDVGSGTLKVIVADVDEKNQKIEKIHFRIEKDMPLKRDMQISGQPRFSEKIQQLALDTLAQLQKELSHYAIQEWRGIATEASRQSENAQELYDRIFQELGIPITIIPQKEEGRMGFITASTVSKVDEEKLLAFDSGGASFQLTTKMDGRLEMVGGQIGNVPALTAFLVDVRGESLESHSLDPMTMDEAKMVVRILQSHLPQMSEAFTQKLHNPNTSVVGIGSARSIFDLGAIATGKKTYTKEELWKAIEDEIEKCLVSQKLPHLVTHALRTKMLLLYSVMDGLSIDKLTFENTIGNCEGLLVDPSYWLISE